MTDFANVRFETGYIIYGTDGGPTYSTDIVVVNSGAEKRNQNWEYALGNWNFGDRKLSESELTDIINFFHARAGMAQGFLFKDWGDYKVTTENGTLGALGVGDGTATYQLTKHYLSGGITNSRLIRKPVQGTFKGYKNGTLLTFGSSAGNISLDYTTGVVTFVAPYPTSGDTLTFSCEFDVPVRFDTDSLKYRFDSAEVLSPGVLGTKFFYLSSLPLVEIRV
jgi:uncharacterized protein (TIGR02217 family)